MTKPWTSSIALLTLLAITFAGFTSAEAVPLSLAASAAALGAGLVKVNIVISHFMHLRWHHAPFRQVLLAWLLLVTAILLGGLWMLPWP